MSDEDKTLKDTVGTALKETADTSTQKPTETDKGMSPDDTAAETKTGETEYVSGIDISDVPVENRAKIKELLSKKAKLIEDGYQDKFKEVAELKRVQGQLKQLGLEATEVQSVLTKHAETKRSSKPALSEEKKEADNYFDELLQQATDYDAQGNYTGQKTMILKFKDSIRKVANVEQLEKKVAQLEGALGAYSQQSQGALRKQRETDLIQLEETYGKELIDEIRDKITNDVGIRFTDSTETLVHLVTPPEKLRQAILSKGRRPLTKEKKEAISSTGEGVSTATEKIETKGRSTKDVLFDVLKLKK